MKISSRFSVAIHILAVLAILKEEVCTSELIAGSIKNNPVVVRRIIGMLKRAGFIEVNLGCGGAHLIKPAEDITLYDIYKAVEVVEEDGLFQIHENTCKECMVGANIPNILEEILPKAQKAMEEVLKSYTLKEITESIENFSDNQEEEE